MEFIEIAAIVGAVISALSALISFRLVNTRLHIEKELMEKLHHRLMVNATLRRELEKAKANSEVEVEIVKHMAEYQKLVSSVLESLPQDSRLKIYPAIEQRSEKGRLKYISKLLSAAI